MKLTERHVDGDLESYEDAPNVNLTVTLTTAIVYVILFENYDVKQ